VIAVDAPAVKVAFVTARIWVPACDVDSRIRHVESLGGRYVARHDDDDDVMVVFKVPVTESTAAAK